MGSKEEFIVANLVARSTWVDRALAARASTPLHLLAGGVVVVIPLSAASDVGAQTVVDPEIVPAARMRAADTTPWSTIGQ